MTLSFVLSIAIKSTVILALGLAGLRLLHRSRAAVRHLLLLAVCAVIFVLPIAALVLPAFEVSLPYRAADVISPAMQTRHSDVAFHLASAARDAAPPAGGVAERVSLGRVVLIGESLGAAMTLLPLIVGVWQTRRLRACARPSSRGQARADRLAMDMGIRRHVRVLIDDSLASPVTCGVWRPVILFPADAERWRVDDFDRAAIHELEHVRRHDWATDCFARLVCAAYWFHPLVWTTRRQLRFESERAADDAVVRVQEPTAYADQLITLARRLEAHGRQPSLAMASRRDLPARVTAILDASRPRGRAGVGRAVFAVAAAVAVSAVIAPLRAIAVPQDAGVGGRVVVDVASIRPNTTGSLNRGTRGAPDGSVQATNMSVMDLITYAYGVRESEVSGGPGWLRSSLYDIAAKPAGNGTPQQIPQLLQSLLEERFQLKVHREQREMPIYSLRVAQGGPRFQPAREGSCGTEPARSPREIIGSCGYNMLGPATFDMLAAPMTRLVAALSALAGRRVVDETGLTGTYSLHMDFAPDQANDPSRVSVFTAVREQLGLRLESARSPVEVLVIDSVERPSEN